MTSASPWNLSLHKSLVAVNCSDVECENESCCFWRRSGGLVLIVAPWSMHSESSIMDSNLWLSIKATQGSVRSTLAYSGIVV